MVETTVNIDGNVIKLKYPNSAVFEMDKKMDHSTMHLMERAMEKGTMSSFSLADIATVLWGGMLHNKPGLQVKQVADMIPIHDMEKFIPIGEKVFEIVTEIYGFEGKAEIIPEEGEVEQGNSGKAPSNGAGNE